MDVPSASVRTAGAVGLHGAGDDPGAGAGDTEAGTLLVDEVHDADGAGGLEPFVPQRVHGRKGADHPKRPVEGAAVRDAVEVRPRDDALVAAGGRASGSPHQAHWLPIRSSVRSRPRAAHSPANHSRRSWSSRVQAKRR